MSLNLIISAETRMLKKRQPLFLASLALHNSFVMIWENLFIAEALIIFYKEKDAARQH